MRYKKEIWKDVDGFEAVYKISSHGRLKSYKKNKNGNILKNTNKKGQYFSVVLSFKGKRKSTSMHRLVANAFIANPFNKKFVNHIDLNKQNNDVSNLEWVSPKENVMHSLKHKPEIIKGMINYNKRRSKALIQKDKSNKIIGIFLNAQSASFQTGVCQRNTTQVAAKEEYKSGMVRTQAGGYKWEYANGRYGS